MFLVLVFLFRLLYGIVVRFVKNDREDVLRVVLFICGLVRGSLGIVGDR